MPGHAVGLKPYILPSDTGEGAMNSDWREAAQAAGVTSEVFPILQALAEAHGLHPCARGGSGEVGMGAAPDAYAAFYVSHRGITLALDPADAKDLASKFNLPLVSKNPTTFYVKCASARFGEADFMSTVRQAAEHALVRSWKGPRWDRFGASGSLAKIQPTCPVHHYELSVSGVCMGCDDLAPEL
jgi:hypothetical protein